MKRDPLILDCKTRAITNARQGINSGLIHSKPRINLLMQRRTDALSFRFHRIMGASALRIV